MHDTPQAAGSHRARRPSSRWRWALPGLFSVLLVLTGPAAAQGADAACVKCHPEIGAGKVVHAALKDGCVKCHSALDGSVKPHKNRGDVKGGLAAKGSALCYGCHEREAFAKKKRHAALGRCTDCHDAHASKHDKLLTEDASTLCFGCHERKDFEARFKHEPAAEGNCLACHDAHASDEPPLLGASATRLCLDCHKKVPKSPHAVAGFGGRGHPIGGEKPGLADPARPERPFYCGSCHDPHKGQSARLMRYDVQAAMDYCQRCHPR